MNLHHHPQYYKSPAVSGHRELLLDTTSYRNRRKHDSSSPYLISIQKQPVHRVINPLLPRSFKLSPFYLTAETDHLMQTPSPYFQPVLVNLPSFIKHLFLYQYPFTKLCIGNHGACKLSIVPQKFSKAVLRCGGE